MNDALSDLLRLIRLTGTCYFRSDFPAPWGMAVDAGPVSQYHLVLRGTCWLTAPGLAAPVSLSAGDVVLFPRGDAHRLSDTPERPCRDGQAVLSALRSGQAPFGQGPPATTLVCGHFAFDRDLDHPFLRHLPSVIHVRGTDARRRSRLEAVVGLLIQETAAPAPGRALVVDRLAEVLFIETLRAWVEAAGPTAGFLAALEDPPVATALRQVHAAPEKPWTLAALAREAGLSRSAFATRFRTLVGQTPMAYLTAWRMHRARRMLEHSPLPLPDIAERVGYTSEAAFHRAFKRVCGQPPGAFRRNRRSA